MLSVDCDHGYSSVIRAVTSTHSLVAFYQFAKPLPKSQFNHVSLFPCNSFLLPWIHFIALLFPLTHPLSQPSACPRCCRWSRRNQPAGGGQKVRVRGRWRRSWGSSRCKWSALDHCADHTACRMSRLSQWSLRYHWGKTTEGWRRVGILTCTWNWR